MQKNQKKLIKEQLTLAGEHSVISPMYLKLDSLRVMIQGDIPEEDFLFRINGMPCFPRKDISCITGQAKTGKTVFTSLLMGCGIRITNDRQILEIERIREEPLKVMWVDTEQSPQSTQGILKKRVAKLAKSSKDDDKWLLPENLLYVFNIRSTEIDERYDLIAEGVEAYHPDIVIIDNIRDLMHDINDGEKAQELIERLMKMATGQNCNIACVLHQNRSADNRGLRGWLGTEMMNKVFEVFVCQKIRQKEGKKPTFYVEQSMTRKYDIDEPLCYQMNSEGLPEAAELSDVQDKEEYSEYKLLGKAKVETLNSEYIIQQPENTKYPWKWDYRKLFSKVMGSRATMGYQDLMNAVMKEGRINHKNYYEKMFSRAEEARVVRKDKDNCGRVVVILLPL